MHSLQKIKQIKDNQNMITWKPIKRIPHHPRKDFLTSGQMALLLYTKSKQSHVPLVTGVTSYKANNITAMLSPQVFSLLLAMPMPKMLSVPIYAT